MPGLIITGVGMLAQHDAGGRIGGKALADAAIISGGHNSTPNPWLQHCLSNSLIIIIGIISFVTIIRL
eukprot:COSAG01_NODE_2934_length_6829_cov_7.598217_8_plen_68_part_00